MCGHTIQCMHRRKPPDRGTLQNKSAGNLRLEKHKAKREFWHNTGGRLQGRWAVRARA